MPTAGSAGAPGAPQAGTTAAGSLAGAAGQQAPVASAPLAAAASDAGCSIHATGTRERSPSGRLTLPVLVALAACMRSARRTARLRALVDQQRS